MSEESLESVLESKVVLLGSTGVGKTSVARRYVKKSYLANDSSTVGASFFTKKLQYRTVDGCSVRLQIWDTAGQERFRAMAPMYYRSASAVILVYDITSEDSFKDMKLWLKEIKNNLDNPIIHIVGNKLDLESERKVSIDEALEFYKSKSYIEALHEVSAKDDPEGAIADIFGGIARSLVERENTSTNTNTDINTDTNTNTNSPGKISILNFGKVEGNLASKKTSCCSN